MMVKNLIEEYINTSGFNIIDRDEAISEEYIGMVIFDQPLIGYANAEDLIFDEYITNSSILNNRFMHPRDWLDGAKTVISVFFPFSEDVKKSNEDNPLEPSVKWLHARYEGQTHLNQMTAYIRDKIIAKGYRCIAPALSDRYIGKFVEDEKSNKDFGGNWSERHAAYAAGLGTFGLSGGLITKRGMAGRFLSLITDMEHEATKRDYSGVYDYCNMCGICIKNCPAGAISFDNGKMHLPCKQYLEKVKKKHSPRYGCGKCQTAVPCMNSAPVTLG